MFAKIKDYIDLKIENKNLIRRNGELLRQNAKHAVKIVGQMEQIETLTAALEATKAEHLQDVTELEDELDRVTALKDALLNTNARLVSLLKERGVELGDAEHFICLSAEEV